MYLAKIYITLKTAVNDPAGQTIQGSLVDLGFSSVVTVRSGKYFEVLLDTPDETETRTAVTTMCDKLLSNPVIEDYQFEIETS